MVLLYDRPSCTAPSQAVIRKKQFSKSLRDAIIMPALKQFESTNPGVRINPDSVVVTVDGVSTGSTAAVSTFARADGR